MNQFTKVEEQDSELVDVIATGAALALTESTSLGISRVEIDMQMSTARAYPRSVARASKNIRDLVTMDRDTAAECMYALPRGGKPIQGPSIRLAEIIFQCWGNARCEARVVEIDRQEKVVVAEGIYHDLETNSAGRATVRRSIVDRQGKIYKDDMITVTGNAACSIAKRNAILAGVPKAVWNRAYESAKEVVAGTIKTLAVSRDSAIAAFANFGVKPEQIFPAIGVAGVEEITLDHIPVLRGMFSAIKNGEATVEEMFNPRKTASTHEKVANPLADAPDHDPDTGEVIDAAQAVTSETTTSDAPPAGDAPLLPDAVTDPFLAEDAGKMKLMETLRAKASKGTAALRRAIVGLVPAQNEMLSGDDHEELGRIADNADKTHGEKA